MDLGLLAHGFLRLLTDPELVFWVFVGGQLGIAFGLMPGLTTTAALSLLTGLTFHLGPEPAIGILIGAYIGSVTGGSRSAILLNIPGTPAQAAVCLDGYQLARQGKAAEAMGLSLTASTLGTFFGVLMLAVFTPTLGAVALQFGTWEFFWLAVLGVAAAGNVAATDPLKGWLAAVLGLLLATVGQDGLHGYTRFTGGSFELRGGFNLLPVLIGVYGVPEVLNALRRRETFRIETELGRVLPRVREVLRYWRHILRSGAIGTFIGIVPGVGSDVASWMSYDAAKRASREPEKFGKGSIEGLIAAETGDNACIGGDIIPVLTLAIPGSAPAAVLLAALTIHGLQPGPLMVVRQPERVGEIIAMCLVATLATFLLSLLWVRQMTRILLVPRHILMPVVFVVATLGSYLVSGRLFDVYVTVAFGIAGLALQESGYPAAPLVLGFILGPMIEDNLRRGLELTGGSPWPFFTRPISALLFLLTVASLVGRTPLWGRVAAVLARLRAGARR